jgi:antitoxin component YwqK of YwqJK toxin-antitoxin module
LEQEGDCHAKWDPKREIVSAKNDTVTYLKRFSKDCHLLEEFTCRNGRLDGTFSLYYESYGETLDSANCGTGRLRVQGVLGKGSTGKDSALIGTVTYYRADGTPMKQEHWDRDGKRDSVWRWFDENGTIVRECDLKVSGVVYGACEGNMSKFCAETSYVGEIGGLLDSSNLAQSANFEQSIGKFPATIRYFKPGRALLYEEYWKDGKIAESRSFFPDTMGGKLASETFWKDGKRNGIMRNWYASGVLRDSLTYVNGERVGEQFSYDTTGKLTIHKTEAGKNRPVIMHLLGE